MLKNFKIFLKIIFLYAIIGKFKLKLKISSKSREKKSKTGLSLLSAFLISFKKNYWPEKAERG